MSIPLLSSDEIFKKINLYSYQQKKTYLAMYSSWYGGIVKDPALMLIPIDDHLVHRGDGVFEAMKYVRGEIYLLQDHLDRLESSALQLGMKWPFSRDHLATILMDTIRASGAVEAVLRVFLSRGPGGFTTNPYDSVGTQLYVVVTELKSLPEEKYRLGASIGKSQVLPKDPWFATIKSCNYLQNVMMKKEAVDRGLDFTVGFDQQGFLTEGSTENIVLLDPAGNLLRPSLRQVLRGTTMMRVFHLAKSLVEQKAIRGLEERDLTEKDILNAKEVMMMGTTLDVLPITSFEGKNIGDGKVGLIAPTLRRLLLEDMGLGH